MDKIKKFIQFSLSKFQIAIKKLDRNFDVIIDEIVKKSYPDKTVLTVFDVGGHDGSSVERFIKLFKEQTVIHSFEPSRTFYNVISTKYGKTDKIFLHNIGVGYKAEPLLFYEHSTSSGSSSFLSTLDDTYFSSRRNLKDSNTKTYFVDVVSLDDFCLKNKIDHIHFLKIDVQGFEEEVLRGGTNLLRNHQVDLIEVEVIIVDAYRKRITFYDIEGLLIVHGYRLVALSNDRRYYNLAAFDILKNPELQFDLLYASPEIYRRITNSMPNDGAP